MIKDRPKHLMEWKEYQQLPNEQFGINFASLPQLVNFSLFEIGGIQPVTGAMGKAAGGILRDNPSKGEIELFRVKGTKFQMVSVVANIAALKIENDQLLGIPYAVTLIPAQKRGSVDERTIDFLANVDLENLLTEKPCYQRYDPFKGDWSLYGNINLLGPGGKGFIDELGMVIHQYFLATEYDETDVLRLKSDFPDEKRDAKYNNHRQKLLYTPFKKPESRRVWGAESPIELFLLQELLRRGVTPVLQMLIYDNGAVHPSLYDLWRDLEMRYAPGMITEADMYFPAKRVAVFCDSTKHHRGAKAIAKDQAINERLKKVGIRPVRIPGTAIIRDLSGAAELVMEALG
jgi:hypothetical protein